MSVFGKAVARLSLSLLDATQVAGQQPGPSGRLRFGLLVRRSIHLEFYFEGLISSKRSASGRPIAGFAFTQVPSHTNSSMAAARSRVPAPKATFGKALVGNDGFTRIGFVKQPARSRSRPFQADFARSSMSSMARICSRILSKAGFAVSSNHAGTLGCGSTNAADITTIREMSVARHRFDQLGGFPRCKEVADRWPSRD